MTQALLVMDVQNGIVDRFGAAEAYLDRVVAAQERAERALADLCLDGDDEVHRVLTQKIFPRQAEVIAGADWRP